MALADAFSAENVGNLMDDPRMLLGLQLMSQGRQGSGAQALGQAGSQAAQMMQQMQHQQGLQQYRQQIAAQQQQAQELQLRQFQAKQEAAQRQQQAFQSPELQQSLGPISRQLAQLGLDPETILRAQSNDSLNAHRQAQLAQNQGQFDMRQAHVGAGGGGGNGGDRGPKVPTPRQVLEEPLENGMLQKHIFDPTINAYKPYGKPYRQYAPGKADPMQALLGEVMPDDNTGAGPAVAGLPGTNAATFTKQPVQGAELLMHSSGANPMARPPSNSTADAILSGITPPDGKAVVDGILAGVTPKYGTPPKASAPPAASQPYPGAPAVGTVRKGFKYLGGNPADPKSWSKV